jgi:hypothetical protein
MKNLSKMELYKDTQEAVFLFEEDIVKYLQEIQDKASELYIIQKKPSPERDFHKETELLLWFDQITSQNRKIMDVFSPYLKFKVWK